MHDQVRHLSRLVDDLFELARIDAGALTLELREVRLDGLVEGCVRGVEARAEARGVRLESRVEGGVPAVRCAPDHLERVLLNLLTNALRHTPSDGSVAVLVASASDGVRVSVEDTGEGIAPEALERAFERFWRADSARRRDGAGAGLGLAIARGLVEAQGGRIWAEERPGGGARVSLRPAGGQCVVRQRPDLPLSGRSGRQNGPYRDRFDSAPPGFARDTSRYTDHGGRKTKNLVSGLRPQQRRIRARPR